MTRPLVSILTPSFNYGRFIGDCIASVANQTYVDVEHIVCDGASTDDTLDVLQDAPAHACWLSEPDRGQSHALNKALSMSRGEIIGWLNADDAFADTRAVERALSIFEEQPDVGVVYGHALMVNANNRVLQVMWAPSFAGALLSRMTTFVQPSVFLRRGVLPELFVREDLRFVMNRDLWLRLRDVTRFRRLDLFVGVDRQHPGRKVMSQAFVDEMAAHNATCTSASLPLALTKAVTVALRLRGVLSVPALADKLQPAFHLHLDRPVTFALRQLILPRRAFPTT